MKKEFISRLLLFFVITLFFFYPVLKGHIPFPGDLLVSTSPYSYYSYLGYAPGGVPNKAQGPDVFRILYPWKEFSMEQLQKMTLPLWNPYNFSGNPHFANLQSGVFSPFTPLFLLFPFHFAWTSYLFLGPLLSSLFMYFFLKKLGLSNEASVFGGIVFAFSGFMTVWMEYGNFQAAFLWLPLILLFVKLYQETSRFHYLFLVSLVLLLSLLSGYIQLTLYVYLVTFLFSCFLFFREQNKQRMGKKYFFLLIAFACSLFLGAVQLFPLYEIFSHSARNAFSFSDLSERLIPAVNLITLFVPDFFGNPATRNYFLSGTYIERVGYIGIVPLLFVSFVWYCRKNPYALFFFFLGILSYFSALDIYPVKLLHSLGLPVLSTTVPSRILSVFCFAFAIVAAVGFDYWQKSKEKSQFIKVLFVIGVFLGSVWIFILLQHDPNFAITKRNLIIPTALFFFSFILFIQTFVPKKITLILLVLLTVVDLFYFFHKITPFSPREFVYPQDTVFKKLADIQGIQRFWGYGSSSIIASINLPYRLYSPEGYDPLFIKRYGELVATSLDGNIPEKIPRTDVVIYPGYGPDDLKNNQYRKRILDLLGVSYIIYARNPMEADEPDKITFPEDRYRFLYNDEQVQIYENKDALPRIFLAGEVLVEKNPEAIMTKIFDQKVDLRKTVILEEDLPMNLLPEKDPNAQLRLIAYEPNKIVIQTTASKNQMLFLSDTFFPGWKAMVDEREQQLYRADYAFRAVALSPGEHTVVFSYRPESFYWGMIISISTFTFMMIGWFFLRKKLV